MEKLETFIVDNYSSTCRKNGRLFYVCNVCQVKSDTKYHFRNHYNSQHTLCRNSKMMYCCGTRFNTRHERSVHINLVHATQRFVCRFCDKRFHYHSNFNIHLERHATFKKFSCSVCPFHTPVRNAIFNHCRIYHKDLTVKVVFESNIFGAVEMVVNSRSNSKSKKTSTDSSSTQEQLASNDMHGMMVQDFHGHLSHSEASISLPGTVTSSSCSSVPVEDHEILETDFDISSDDIQLLDQLLHSTEITDLNNLL